MDNKPPLPPLSDAEAAFIHRRQQFIRWWPWMATCLFLLLGVLLAALFMKTPLLVHPARVWSGLRDSTMDPSTTALLAALLPVVLLGWLATAAIVILFVFAALSNEKKYIGLLDRFVRPGNSHKQSPDMTPDQGNGHVGVAVSGLDHLVLTVRNVETTVRFYSDVLGMRREVFGDGRVALRFGGQKINLHPSGRERSPHAEHPVPGSADICFLTRTPPEQVVEHLSKSGVPIIDGPVERTGAMGPIISFYVRDPDGNLVELARHNQEN